MSFSVHMLGGARRWWQDLFQDRLARRFIKVYDENAWGDDQTRSGPGSRRDAASVAEALDALEFVVREHEVRSLNDIPCGDFNWMWRFLEAHPEISYCGYDIVPAAVRANREKAAGRRFEVLNIATTIPPSCDLIFCKDLLNHLTFSDVLSALHNMVRSGSKLLLASNNFGHDNLELPSDCGGHSRHLDITASPLHLAKPLWHTDYLGLWRLSDLRASLSRR